MARPPARTAAQARRRRAAPALVQIGIAVPDAETAARISMTLLELQLCACAQTVGPVTSRYRWRGNLEIASEYLLLVKTRRSRYAAVEAAVRALHPYDVPEILATPVLAAWAPYAAWVAESTTAPRTRTARKPRAAGKPGTVRTARAGRSRRSS